MLPWTIQTPIDVSTAAENYVAAARLDLFRFDPLRGGVAASCDRTCHHGSLASLPG
jgi:hypothetical protein